MVEPEHHELRSELKDLRKEVTSRLDKLAEALGSLIRIEERLSRQNDALSRTARAVEDHEMRIRGLETRQTGDKVRWDVSTWLVAFLLTTVGGGVVGLMVAFVLYLMGIGK